MLQTYQHEIRPAHQEIASNDYRVASLNDRNSLSGKTTSNVDMLSNEVAILCLSAADREPQFFGSSSAVFFSRIASASIKLPLQQSDWDGSPQVRDEIENQPKLCLASVVNSRLEMRVVSLLRQPWMVWIHWNPISI